MRSKVRVQVKAVLSDREWYRFYELKQHLGVKSDAETIRAAIRAAHKTLVG